MYESKDTCFGTEVKKHRDRRRGKAFELGPIVLKAVVAAIASCVYGHVAHVYVYNTVLVEDSFPNKKTDFVRKAREHLRMILDCVLLLVFNM